MNKIPVITGGIGSGKSTLAAVFEKKGFKVISADYESQLITQEKQKEISKHFGFLAQKYTSFKTRLASKVFSDPEAKKYIEKLVLPLIRQAIKKRIKEYKDQGLDYIVEMPTFFETKGLKRHKDYYVFLVVAETPERVKRIMKRNEMSFDDAKKRISSQLSDLPKCQYSDIIVYNDNIDLYIERCNEIVGEFLTNEELK